MKIGIVAPASRIEPALAEKAIAIARELYGDRVELRFHPQCYLSSGHFAGADSERAEAFLEIANDARFEVLWWARGGYGSNRIAEPVLAGLKPAARRKIFFGYSDAGFLLGPLYKAGMRVVHGPMIADLNRDEMSARDPASTGTQGESGIVAVKRALCWLAERDVSALEPATQSGMPLAAFNLTVFANLVGTPFQPDLSGHILMLEDVSEHLYAIDRLFFHITSNAGVRKAAGIMLGRCSDIPANDPPFGSDEEAIAKDWCARSGIAWLGRADIGHDIHNKIVPFGMPESWIA